MSRLRLALVAVLLGGISSAAQPSQAIKVVLPGYTADALVHSPDGSTWNWCGGLDTLLIESPASEPTSKFATYTCLANASGSISRCKLRLQQFTFFSFSKHFFLECDEGMPFGLPPMFTSGVEGGGRK